MIADAQILRDRRPFDGPADLGAERSNRLSVVRIEPIEPIEPIVDRRCFCQDPLEGVRRHAKARRHPDALDPRKLPEARPLAPNDRDLRLVNLLEVQHVATHPLTSLGVDPVNSARVLLGLLRERDAVGEVAEGAGSAGDLGKQTPVVERVSRRAARMKSAKP